MNTDIGSINDNISVIIGDDLLPHCTLDKFTSNVRIEHIPFKAASPEVDEEARRIYRDMLKKRALDFTNGVDIFNDFRYIDIDKLEKSDSGWNYFDKPGPMELLNLISSIETIGLLTPLIVKPLNDETFTIICGNSRYAAFVNLYTKTENEKFAKIPCFVIDKNLDEYYERSIILDSNINYRRVSQEVFIKAIFEKFELLNRIKSYRGESNVAQIIAEHMQISESTVFNYLTLKKLCPEAMALVYDKRLKLKCARLLAKLNHDNQMYILKNVKLEDVNAYHKLKVLTNNPNAPTHEIKAKSEFIENFIPQFTDINIKVNKNALVDLITDLTDFKEFIFGKFSGTMHEKLIQQLVKVKINKEHMRFYVRHKFLDGKLIEAVTGKDLNELFSV
ncbi:MAG: ParB/RepB/Spo0J family partition protein [Oscillospiraceae bacterium]|nr:ParB/RepB/Spo0J family partition protein [Oscillospiraceae bacterium]